MKLHRLGYNSEGEKISSRRPKKRVGRGIGSGTGKTSGRGHDGQNARSGGGVRVGFEGGQTPLFRRLPKRGFTNPTKKQFIIIDLDQLNKFEENSEVTPEFLHENKVITNSELAKIKKGKVGIKVLGSGDLSKKLTVKATKFTASAEEKINAIGGNVEVI